MYYNTDCKSNILIAVNYFVVEYKKLCSATLRKLTVTILSLFNYPLNEAACPPVSTVYSLIMPSEGSYTLMRVH